MKIYLEALEDKEPGKIAPHNIREEIKNGNLDLAKTKLSPKKIEGKTYKYTKHTCYHDEKPPKPCTEEVYVWQ